MAADSAASTSSRKEFDQLAEPGVLETAAVLCDLPGAGTTFETETEHEWSSKGSRATRNIQPQPREESVRPEDDHFLRGQAGHCHVDLPVNVKAARTGEFNLRESAAKESTARENLIGQTQRQLGGDDSTDYPKG